MRKPYTVFVDKLPDTGVPSFCRDYATRAAALTAFGKLAGETTLRVWVRDYTDPNSPQTIAETGG